MQGANQAAAAAQLDCDTVMVGQVGGDSGAEFMCEALRAAGVSTHAVATVDSVATGTAVVLLQPGGENSIVIVGGANTAEWRWPQEARDAVASADAVLLQREVPEATNLAAARMCVDAGVPVTLDAGGAEGPLSQELCECLHTVSPNETELVRLADMATGTRDEVAAAARCLQGQCGGCDVLVKLGAKGCLLLQRGAMSASAVTIMRCFSAAPATSALVCKRMSVANTSANVALLSSLRGCASMTGSWAPLLQAATF